MTDEKEFDLVTVPANWDKKAAKSSKRGFYPWSSEREVPLAMIRWRDYCKQNKLPFVTIRKRGWRAIIHARCDYAPFNLGAFLKEALLEVRKLSDVIETDEPAPRHMLTVNISFPDAEKVAGVIAMIALKHVTPEAAAV